MTLKVPKQEVEYRFHQESRSEHYSICPTCGHKHLGDPDWPEESNLPFLLGGMVIGFCTAAFIAFVLWGVWVR